MSSNRIEHIEERSNVEAMPSASPPMTVPNASPFLLGIEDMETLSQSEGFRILRSHLAAHYSHE